MVSIAAMPTQFLAATKGSLPSSPVILWMTTSPPGRSGRASAMTMSPSPCTYTAVGHSVHRQQSLMLALSVLGWLSKVPLSVTAVQSEPGLYLNSTTHPVEARSKIGYCCRCKGLSYFLLRLLLPFGKRVLRWQSCMLCSCNVSPALTLVCAIKPAAKLRGIAARSQTSAIGAHAHAKGSCSAGENFRSQVWWHAQNFRGHCLQGLDNHKPAPGNTTLKRKPR